MTTSGEMKVYGITKTVMTNIGGKSMTIGVAEYDTMMIGEDMVMIDVAIGNDRVKGGKGVTITDERMVRIKIIDVILGPNRSNYRDLMALIRMGGFTEQICSSKPAVMKGTTSCD